MSLNFLLEIRIIEIRADVAELVDAQVSENSALLLILNTFFFGHSIKSITFQISNTLTFIFISQSCANSCALN